MTKPTENQPVAVPERATRTGEIWRRWLWVEPVVWTERMLTALNKGSKEANNAFFAAHGLYSLATAHATFRQSSLR